MLNRVLDVLEFGADCYLAVVDWIKRHPHWTLWCAGLLFAVSHWVR
jgi:hypothetical protein